jgi:ribosome biogenesis GTPase A
MVVVVGEFNAGKSTFINALLGQKVLKEGILPTTSKIGILKSSTKTYTEDLGIWKKSDNILVDDVEGINRIVTNENYF